MSKLTVTARGQVTFRREVLQHLGVRPGEKIVLELMPGGRAELQAAPAEGSIRGFIGLLAGKKKKVASLAEMERAAQAGWAGER